MSSSKKKKKLTSADIIFGFVAGHRTKVVGASFGLNTPFLLLFSISLFPYVRLKKQAKKTYMLEHTHRKGDNKLVQSTDVTWLQWSRCAISVCKTQAHSFDYMEPIVFFLYTLNLIPTIDRSPATFVRTTLLSVSYTYPHPHIHTKYNGSMHGQEKMVSSFNPNI